MFPGRRFTKEFLTHFRGYVTHATKTRPRNTKSKDSNPVSPATSVCHRGQAKCRLKLDDPSVSDRMISTFIRQYPYCQYVYSAVPKTHLFNCASYHPFEVIHLDRISPLRSDTHGNMFIFVLIDAFSRWVESRRHVYSNINEPIVRC